MDVTNETQSSSRSSNQAAQNKAENPLGISHEDIQKVLQIKCQKHPKSNAYYLHLISDVENARICNVCVKQDDISRKNYEDIREIFKESSERELISYPVLIDSEPSKRIQNNDDSMDSQIIIMDRYFQELTNEIEVKIRGRKEARKLKLMQYGDIHQKSQACWSEIIDLENLQQILLENNKERLSQFVRNHISNAEKNTQKIKEVFEGIKDEFSEEQPNKIRNLICQLLEEIDFYNGTHPSPLHSIEQSDEYQNALQTKQKELDDWQTQINQAHDQQQLLLLEEIRNLNEKHSQEINSLRQEISCLNQQIQVIKSLIL